ncbi:hypothetical protein SY88_08010 [Clostridiales bacterium PH28_bin88]|nr:hypothetical protein SY88_08010 [Clostridiales bacterium PH28_bin88]
MTKKLMVMLVVLFLALAFMSTTAFAFDKLSPDGKTCTPCHTDGRTGGAKPAPAPAKPAPAPAKAAPAPAPAKAAPVKGVLVKDFAAVLQNLGYQVDAQNGDAALTREMAASLVVKALGLKTDGADTSVLNKFRDAKQVSASLKNDVAAAVKEGLFVGYGKTFGFKDQMTDKQVQAIQWKLAARKAQKPVEKSAALNIKLGVEGYVGSEACGKCHADAYKSWNQTAHSKMGQIITDGVVVPEINWSTQLTTTKDKDGKEIPIQQFDLNGLKVPGLKQTNYAKPVFTIGSVHKQRFVFDTNKDGDAAVIDVNDLVILPQEWIRPAYNQGAKWQDYNSTSWNDWKKCAGCHFTGVKADVVTKKVQVNEFNIGCEACHGPGAEHAKTADKTKIYKSANGNACGQCHTRGWNDYKTKVFEFIPNAMPWDDPAKVTDKYTHAGEGGNELDAFWGNDPKNPSKKHHQQYLDWRQTGHATIFEENIKLPNFGDSCLACHSATAFIAKENGETLKLADFKEGGKYANDRAGVTCVVCHASHTTKTVKEMKPANLRKSREETCVQCHKESGQIFKGDVASLQKGKKVVATSIPSATTQTCVDCHMPRVAKSGVNGDLASHQFKPVAKSQADAWKLPAHTVVASDDGIAKKADFDKAKAALADRVKAAEAKFATVDKAAEHYAHAKEALDGAIANNWILYKDPGAGYHNLPFAEELLSKANANLDKFESLVK